MDWKDIAGTLARSGAPAIGTILGGPMGGAIGGLVGNTIAAALGVEPTPEAVSTAVASGDPAAVSAALSAADQKIMAQYGYLTELAKAESDVGKAQVDAVNESIRAEASASASRADGWWGNWRTIMAYELTAECPFWAALICWCIINGKINELVASASILTVWWGARFGVLGVHVWTGSNERQTAITGVPAKAGVVASVVAAVTKKK
ncbi:hypothetical protein AB8A28_14050 [Tardiphaga sp. 71_E8_N1_1]|uniref:hypothetical protein n=1 Tax=Tardiphaga sp. 71_E8_N1_1 TaxID=3240784 RepID=UPI003F88E79C